MTSDNTGLPSTSDPDDFPEDTGGAYFPLTYIIGMFDYFRRHAADIKILTYDDFAWDGDFDYARNYPGERASWAAGLKSGRFDKSKAHVVIQYDVDAVPQRTLEALRHPGHRDVPANIMIFNRRINRRCLKTTGRLEYTPYDVDDAYLRELQNERFVVGYHTNAFEQGQHDVGGALRAFDVDARSLTERFGLKFFSAHGGVPDADGRNNRDLPFHDEWSSVLRWVHNGYSPYFDGQFSDGGHNSLKRDPELRDMRALVGRFRPGCRYRILLHPQYYAGSYRRSPRYAGTPWYDEMMMLAEAGQDAEVWSDAAVDRAGKTSVGKTILSGVPRTAKDYLSNQRSSYSIALRSVLKRLFGS